MSSSSAWPVQCVMQTAHLSMSGIVSYDVSYVWCSSTQSCTDMYGANISCIRVSADTDCAQAPKDSKAVSLSSYSRPLG